MSTPQEDVARLLDIVDIVKKIEKRNPRWRIGEENLVMNRSSIVGKCDDNITATLEHELGKYTVSQKVCLRIEQASHGETLNLHFSCSDALNTPQTYDFLKKYFEEIVHKLTEPERNKESDRQRREKEAREKFFAS